LRERSGADVVDLPALATKLNILREQAGISDVAELDIDLIIAGSELSCTLEAKPMLQFLESG
jgi:hypothetical protein